MQKSLLLVLMFAACGGRKDAPPPPAAGTCASSCNAGDGAGCYWLGVMYATRSDIDLGVPYDPAKAVANFLAACH